MAVPEVAVRLPGVMTPVPLLKMGESVVEVPEVIDDELEASNVAPSY